MNTSVFDLFKIGIGPSSSHTVGPMLAAYRFGEAMRDEGLLPQIARVEADLYGSLALTGRGHATDTAVMLGLSGEIPATVDPDAVPSIIATIAQTRQVALLGQHKVGFDPETDLHFYRKTRQPYHANAMALAAFAADGREIARRMYYSIGGGFVLDEAEAARNAPAGGDVALPYPFASGADLLAMGEASGLSIAEMMLANEEVHRDRATIEAGLEQIAAAMSACIERGCAQDGQLPGGLRVRRRAKALATQLAERQAMALADPMAVLDWINLWAMAVNEENAAGGRVVTAPTNGAAGIIPAVLRYYERCYRGDAAGRTRFLLTAAAIGALYKQNASISGAEVGCQGEVGVACSMAAGGLTAALGGSNAQIENAAEIGMEHNLGLTCDPVGGLVQIPCIERNAMGAIKAIDASRLAMLGDGQHLVSLDKVIETMRQTGFDMRDKYKETALGGLAVNVVEC
jgi:L-serine dehydratase